MINVNQITSQLAKMPDQTLQRYAQMHKADPYILSLALAESNRRKQMRQGAQMSVPEQPKVVDQAISGMGAGLPALPAQNLQGMEQTMAAGGIVAFDEGGEVERYNGEAGSLIPYGGAYGGAPITGRTGYEGMSPMELARALYEDMMQKIGPGLSPPERAKAERAARAEANKLAVAQTSQGKTYTPEAYGVTTPAPLFPGARGPGPAEVSTPAPSDRAAAPRMAPATAPAAGPEFLGGPGPSAAQPPAGGLYDLATTPAQMKEAMASMGISSGVPKEFTTGITDLQAAQEALANQNVEQLKAEQAARGQAFAGLEQRLKEREGRIGKMEAQQGPMALLQAGLAIMGGTSPHALANIGAGAQVGMKAYSEGLDKLDRARDKIDESLARIEEVRRNESRMDSKEMREAMNAAKQPAIEAKKLGLSALEKNWGFDRQDANKGLELLFGNRRALLEQEGAQQRTAMTTQSQERIAAANRAARAEEAKLLAGRGEVKSDAELREIYAKSILLQQRFPNVNDYIRMVKGTAATQSGQQLSPADAALVDKYLR